MALAYTQIHLYKLYVYLCIAKYCLNFIYLYKFIYIIKKYQGWLNTPIPRVYATALPNYNGTLITRMVGSKKKIEVSKS